MKNCAITIKKIKSAILLALFLTICTSFTPVVDATYYDCDDVPYMKQTDYVNIGEAACGPTSIAMILKYYYPSITITGEDVYHSGTQDYTYNGPAVGYKDVSSAEGDKNIEDIVDEEFWECYKGNNLGMVISYGSNYLKHYWGGTSNVVWGGTTSNVVNVFDNSITEIKNRHPVVMSERYLNYEKYKHYVVVRGYDDENDGTFYVNDPYPWSQYPNGENRPFSYSTLSSWLNNGIITYVPSLDEEHRKYTTLVDGSHVQLDDINAKDNNGNYIWQEHYGGGGDWYYPTTEGHSVTWTPDLETEGRYEIHVIFNDVDHPKSGDIEYSVYSPESSNPVATKSIEIDNRGWRDEILGTFDLKKGSYVRVNSVPAMYNVDAVRFEYVGPSIYNEGNANVMLVIDRSGSMRGSPITSAKNSANLFVDYMESEDKAGVVSFSSTARYDYHLSTLTPKVKSEIKLNISSISASGSTAIGSGLRYGLNDLLDYGDPDIPWAMVLLSDGYQNSGENPSYVVPFIQANNIQVYTIGLGSSVDEDLLKDIASQTGGKYYNSPADSQLQEIYNEIVGKIIGWDTVVTRKIMMLIYDVISIPVEIDSAIEKASFGISWPGSNVDLILYKPDGSVVDPSVADSDPNIEYLTGSTYKIYKVTNPEPGEWTMELTATDMPAGGEDVYITVRAKSTLSMLLSTDKDQYKQGESVKIIAELSDAGTKITTADVEANITLPDSIIESLTLYDDGSHGDGEAQDGVYANFFVNTLLQGDYRIDATSTGSLSDGSQFNRIEDTSFEIIPGSPIIVEAGTDQTVEEGASVNFEGSFTASGSHTYSYHWDFGDSSVEDSSLITSHTYADNGVYTVNLTVTDEEGDFGNDTLLVTVNNIAPDVETGSDLEVTAGDLVSFSGTFSNPGWLDTHTAEWNFGEGTLEAGSVTEENEYPDSTGTVSGSFSYFDAGEYTVTLNVTDDDGGVGQDQLTVTVLPIVATVDINPDTLNLGSGGEWITAYIELPEGYDVAGINASSVFLNGTVSAVTDPKYEFVTNENEYLQDFDGDLILERMLKFDREEVEAILEAGEEVTVTLEGKVEYNNGISSDMASFEGSDVITVIEKKKDKTK